MGLPCFWFRILSQDSECYIWGSSTHPPGETLTISSWLLYFPASCSGADHLHEEVEGPPASCSQSRAKLWGTGCPTSLAAPTRSGLDLGGGEKGRGLMTSGVRGPRKQGYPPQWFQNQISSPTLQMLAPSVLFKTGVLYRKHFQPEMFQSDCSNLTRNTLKFVCSDF